MAAIVLIQPQPRASQTAVKIDAAGHQTLVLSFNQLSVDADGVRTLSERDLRAYDRVVFVSPSSVAFALTAVAGRLNDRQIAAIGQGTATVLSELKLVVNEPLITRPRRPPFDADALLALPAMQPGVLKRVLVVRGQDGRTDWQEALRVAGVHVDDQVVYRSMPTVPDAVQTSQLRELAASRARAVAVVGSIAEFRGLSTWLTGSDLMMAGIWLRTVPTVVPHARIGATLTGQGWQTVQPTRSGQTLLQAALELAASPA